MAEKIIARLRVKETHFAPPISAEADIATAVWKEQPLTYRDDELIIAEEEPEETELYSHENDPAEDIEIIGQGLTARGTFIMATREQMAELMGGTTSGVDAEMKYQRSTQKKVLETAIKFLCYDGTEVIIPRAKGAVTMNVALGKGGLGRFPFKFILQRASKDWDCDLIL